MSLSSRTLALLAALGSAALLIGAFLFQHVGGLAPCPLCIWQRWPHAAAIALGALVWAFGARPALSMLGAVAMLASAGLGLYHTGVERGWWKGPETCAGGQDATLSTDQLLEQIMAAPVVRCTEVAWELFGLSMASWNALASLAFAALWIAAARQGSSSASQ